MLVSWLYDCYSWEISDSISYPARISPASARTVPTQIHFPMNLCHTAEENSRFLSLEGQRKRKHLFSLTVRALNWEGGVLLLIFMLFLYFISYPFQAQQKQKSKFSPLPSICFKSHFGLENLHISTFFFGWTATTVTKFVGALPWGSKNLKKYIEIEIICIISC